MASEHTFRKTAPLATATLLVDICFTKMFFRLNKKNENRSGRGPVV
jgi:hypothetical protein